MKFGVCLPTFRYGAEPTADHVFTIASQAEELGFDSVWVGDHVVVPSDQIRMRFFSDPLTTLATVSGMTSTVMLGTSVIIAPLRNPLVLAKEAATVDYLSGGRLILGLGVGWLKPEYEWVGVDFRTRGRLLDETIHVLRALWGSVPATYDGEFYTFQDAWLEPQPAQSGGPPIWIGGASEHALRRAADLGDGWHADDTPADEVARIKAHLDERTADNGRTVEVSTRVTTRVVESAGQEVDSTDRGEGYYRSADAWSGVQGTPDELYDQVREFADAGSTHYIAQFEHTTVDDHVRAMQLFRDAVIVRFQNSSG